MYHILSLGGVDRGGVTAELPAGVPPHWLPYVNVGDVDATIGRAKKSSATTSPSITVSSGMAESAITIAG